MRPARPHTEPRRRAHRIHPICRTLYGRHSVRCNAVAPGVIDTPALREKCTPQLIDVFAQSTLLPRIGTADDVAEAVAFLASPRAAFITGQTLCVDGGFLAHVPQYAQLEAMDL